MSEQEASKKLFVRSNIHGIQLPPKPVLSTYLSKYGRVVKITDVNKGRTYAFVTFLTAEQAKAAFDAINGSKGGDASNGVNLGRTLFVDFAVEECAKPVHVKAPKLAPAPGPSPLETPKPAPAPRPSHLESPKPALVEDPKPTPVEAPRPSSAPRPAQEEAPKPAQEEAPKPAQEEASKPVLIVESVALPMVYISQRQTPQKMSRPALALLFKLGSSPETKFQGDTPVQMFGNKDEWVIPHPDHPTATQDCQKSFESGTYTEKLTVNIPKGVLESKKFWRD